MNFYTAAPDWDDSDKRPPSTSTKAQPHDLQTVSGPMITVKDAYYRRALFSGTFALAEIPDEIKRNGKQRVKVYCLWFGCRLKSSNPASFLVNMSTAIIDTNGGKVATNIRT